MTINVHRPELHNGLSKVKVKDDCQLVTAISHHTKEYLMFCV